MYQYKFLKRLFILIASFSLLSCGDHNQPGVAVSAVEHTNSGAFAAALSIDGRYSLVSSVAEGVALWDNHSNTLKYQWLQSEQQQNLVHSVAIAYDNSVAVTASDHEFAVWNMQTGHNLGYYQVSKASIRDIAVSNGGRYVLFGQSDNTVVFVDLETGKRLEFLGHSEKINSIALSPNGHFALSGGNDYSAYFWDTRSGQVIHRFNHPSRVTKVALDDSGRYAFTADSMKKASIWQLTSGELVSQLQYIARQKIFSTVRFNATGTLLATGTPNRLLSVWSVKNGERLASWQVTPREGSRPKSAVIFAVAFQDNDATLLAESSNGILERFEREK